MQNFKKYIISIIIIIVFIVSTILYVKSNHQKLLEINEIKIDNVVIQLTNNKDDYDEYKRIEGFEVFNNSTNFEIEIQNDSVITYKNIKVGDSIDKIDFCNNKVGSVYYYETNYRYKGYHMEIIYGSDPFDNTILSITYRFYMK